MSGKGNYWPWNSHVSRTVYRKVELWLKFLRHTLKQTSSTVKCGVSKTTRFKMRTGLHWLATKFRTFRKSCSTSTLPENTCLKLCRFLIVDIFETKILGCILVAILLDILSIILIQTYLFVERFDINYLLTFALSYTMMLYVRYFLILTVYTNSLCRLLLLFCSCRMHGITWNPQ